MLKPLQLDFNWFLRTKIEIRSCFKFSPQHTDINTKELESYNNI